MDRQPCVYILASRMHGTLYAGVTSNLIARLHQHRAGTVDGFTKRYAVHHLVWYELHGAMEHAIAREKAIKRWNRDWKLRLIEEGNPEWVDLAIALGFEPVRPSRPVPGGNDGVNM